MRFRPPHGSAPRPACTTTGPHALQPEGTDQQGGGAEGGCMLTRVHVHSFLGSERGVRNICLLLLVNVFLVEEGFLNEICFINEIHEEHWPTHD